MYTEFCAKEKTNRLVRAYMCIDESDVAGNFFAPALKNTGLVISVRGNIKYQTGKSESIPPKASIKGVFDFPYFYSYIDNCITSLAADFHPIGMYELTGKPGIMFKNKFVDANLIWSKSEVEELYLQLSREISFEERSASFEEFISYKTPQIISEKGLLVERADDLAKRNEYKCSIRDVAQELGVSEKTMHRAFVEVLGVAPKQYFSSALFQEVIRKLAILKREEITDFITSPFYDFSHFNKWFKKFTKVSPKEFINYDLHSVGYALSRLSTDDK